MGERKPNLWPDSELKQRTDNGSKSSVTRARPSWGESGRGYVESSQSSRVLKREDTSYARRAKFFTKTMSTATRFIAFHSVFASRPQEEESFIIDTHLRDSKFRVIALQDTLVFFYFHFFFIRSGLRI